MKLLEQAPKIFGPRVPPYIACFCLCLMISNGQFIEIPNLKKRGLSLSTLFFINRDEDLPWAPSKAPLESHSLLYPDMRRDPRNSPALRSYLPGESFEYAAVIYNAETGKDKKPDLESQYLLFGNGKELLRSKPETVDLTKAHLRKIYSTWRLHTTVAGIGQTGQKPEQRCHAGIGFQSTWEIGSRSDRSRLRIRFECRDFAIANIPGSSWKAERGITRRRVVDWRWDARLLGPPDRSCWRELRCGARHPLNMFRAGGRAPEASQSS
jgi:hypothetical protein